MKLATIGLKRSFLTLAVFALGAVVLHNWADDQHGNKNDVVQTQLGQPLVARPELDKQETTVLVRICAALRAKKFTFSSDLVNSKYAFEVHKKSCQEPEQQYRLTTELRMPASRGSLYYDAKTDRPYFKDVQTHMEGPIAAYCDQVLQGLNAHVFRRISETYQQQLVVQEISPGLDFYKLVTAKQGAQGELLIVMEEHYYLLTDPNSAAKQLGLEVKTAKYSVCENSDSTNMLVQSYLKHAPMEVASQ